MPILNLQRSFAEVGRIRIGEQVATEKGGTRPGKLDAFRLTSADKSRIEAAAQLYGGTPQEWQAPAGKQWEVKTEAESIPVMVPPVADMTFTQWYELWSAAGCQRRCDTVTESISDKPCLCDEDARECKPHSRLSILLPELPGLGVWRLDTQGWYAARELGYSVDNIIALYARRGDLLPATLRLDQRMIKRPGKQTVRFVVPVLDVNESPNELLRKRSLPAGSQTAIEQPRAPLTPVPDDGEPVPSIAEQTAAVQNIPSRQRASTQKIAATGVAPRTAEQARRDRQTPGEPPPQPQTEPDTPTENAVPAQTLDEPPPDPIDQPPPADVEQPSLLDAAETVTLISVQQLAELSILIRDAGLPDKQSRRDFVISIINRDVATVQDLTHDEAATVISTFTSDPLIAARYKLEMLLRTAGFDDPESQNEFVTAAVEHDATLKTLSTIDEINTVTLILESDK